MVADLRHVVFSSFRHNNAKKRKCKNTTKSKSVVSLCFRIFASLRRRSEGTTDWGKYTTDKMCRVFALYLSCLYFFASKKRRYENTKMRQMLTLSCFCIFALSHSCILTFSHCYIFAFRLYKRMRTSITHMLKHLIFKCDNFPDLFFSFLILFP